MFQKITENFRLHAYRLSGEILERKAERILSRDDLSRFLDNSFSISFFIERTILLSIISPSGALMFML